MVNQPHRLARRPFTLVELLAAMSVLIVIMFVLFRFFSSAEKAWTTTSANTELFENARVAFDVIGRDLQAAVARESDVAGQDIRFRQEAADKLWFVSAQRGATAAKADLIEVGYKFASNEFRRACRDDLDTTNWQVYGSRTDPTPTPETSSTKVIDGVLAMNFICAESTLVANWTETGDERPYLPTAVTVQMKLLDRKSFGLWSRLGGTARTDLEGRAARAFSKTIFLGGRN